MVEGEDMGHPGRQLQISCRLGNWAMVWREMEEFVTMSRQQKLPSITSAACGVSMALQVHVCCWSMAEAH